MRGFVFTVAGVLLALSFLPTVDATCVGPACAFTSNPGGSHDPTLCVTVSVDTDPGGWESATACYGFPAFRTDPEGP